MDPKTFFDQFVEWEDDRGLSDFMRGVTKWFFDLLRNVMILALIKYLADRTDSTMVYWLYVIGTGALVVYMFTYIARWRLVPFPFLGNSWMGKLANAAVGGMLVGLFFLLVLTPISVAIEELSKAQQ